MEKKSLTQYPTIQGTSQY